jgi:chemotaxis protein CheY-P-specific phosphatase CheC
MVNGGCVLISQISTKHVRMMEASFEGFSMKNILRLDDEYVDMLAKSVA